MKLKDMIFKGLYDGTVAIISNPNDDYIACQIGDNWFYFIGSEYEDLTPDEVYESFTKEDLTNMIYNTLESFKNDDDFIDEFDYYQSILEENYQQKELKKNNKNY